MDNITVSRNSRLYHLAKFGGFKDWGSPNSCNFISSILTGVMKLGLFTLIGCGAIFVACIGLVALGLPNEVIVFIHELKWLVILWIAGVLAWAAVVIIFFIIILFFLVEYIWPTIKDFIGDMIVKISSRKSKPSRVAEHVSDFLNGICKPVEIID